MAKTKPPAVAKATKPPAAAKAARAAPSALPDGLAPETVEILTFVSGRFLNIGRRSTTEALTLGEDLQKAMDVLPENTFGAWVKAACRISDRLARNYLAASRNLKAYHQRLVASAVSPTILFVLAHGEPAKVEGVITAMEGGERFTVAKTKARVRDEKATKPKAELVRGGVVGFLRAGEAKLKQEGEEFAKCTKAALKHVEKAAATLAANKHVSKKPLAALIEPDCLMASELLRSAIAPISTAAGMSSVWQRVQRTLDTLGHEQRWPGKAEFPVWIRGEALQILRFVVNGTSLDEPADSYAGEELADADDASDVSSAISADLVSMEQVTAAIDAFAGK